MIGMDCQIYSRYFVLTQNLLIYIAWIMKNITAFIIVYPWEITNVIGQNTLQKPDVHT